MPYTFQVCGLPAYPAYIFPRLKKMYYDIMLFFIRLYFFLESSWGLGNCKP